MTNPPVRQWFVVAEQAVDGLGQGELAQSYSIPNQYRATLLLNSYESNCTRDWLALRWKAGSLRYSCISESSNSRLAVSLILDACNLVQAREIFQGWLDRVSSDRQLVIQSRR